MYPLMQRAHGSGAVDLADVTKAIMQKAAGLIEHARQNPTFQHYLPVSVEQRPWQNAWYKATATAKKGRPPLEGKLVVSLSVEAMSESGPIDPASYMPQMLMLVTADNCVQTVIPPALQSNMIFLVVEA